MTIADGAPSTPLDGPLGAAAAELRTIGWRIFSAAWSTRADLRPLVLVGKGGVLVVGTHRTPDDLLALAAGTVTALLPARLRRAVVIENGQDRRSLPALAAALENRLDDAEILQITTALDRLDPARLVTTAHILEWTKDARPEPTRHSHRPLVGSGSPSSSPGTRFWWASSSARSPCCSWCPPGSGRLPSPRPARPVAPCSRPISPGPTPRRSPSPGSSCVPGSFTDVRIPERH